MGVIVGGIKGRVIMEVAGDGGVSDCAFSGRVCDVGDGRGGGMLLFGCMRGIGIRVLGIKIGYGSVTRDGGLGGAFGRGLGVLVGDMGGR